MTWLWVCEEYKGWKKTNHSDKQNKECVQACHNKPQSRINVHVNVRLGQSREQEGFSSELYREISTYMVTALTVHTWMGVGITPTTTNHKICSSKNHNNLPFADAGLYMSTSSSLDLKNLYFEAMWMLSVRQRRTTRMRLVTVWSEIWQILRCVFFSREPCTLPCLPSIQTTPILTFTPISPDENRWGSHLEITTSLLPPNDSASCHNLHYL